LVFAALGFLQFREGIGAVALFVLDVVVGVGFFCGLD
jgi:hypothetical protein